MTQGTKRPGAAGERVLAIDLGTTAVKAAVIDDGDGVVATGSATQRTLTGEVGRREQVPAETWRAVRTAVRDASDRWATAERSGRSA